MRANDAAPVVTVENLIWAASIACLALFMSFDSRCSRLREAA
ncbi:hypothetical protein AB0442_23170 [Kitasatospora sp. NPDC085895]